ncbi:MAG: hypothetical protein WCB96_07540 [Candidatus Aminicenantales bacterium]
MKYKKLTCLVLAVLFLASLSALAETKKITSMGHYTFARIRGNVPTEKVMKTLVDKYAADIKAGFEMAGYGDLYQPFINQVQTATFKDKQIMPGEKFMWMLFRSQGKIKLVQDLEWAGAAPLDVYAFTVNKDFKNYEFIIPKPCGNIALLGITPVLLPAICDLKVTPAKANLSESFSVDMSGSKNADTLEVTVFNASGAKVATQVLTPASPKWQTKFDKPGDYVFKAKAANALGPVTGPGCEAKVHVNLPPTCQLKISCTQCYDYVGKPIVFDASGSADQDGQVVKASFEVTDAAGQVVDSYMATAAPFLWQKVFDTAGNYVITVTVFDDMGATAGGADSCRIPFTMTQRKLFGIVEFGPMLCRGTYTGFIFARAGILYKITPDVLDFILTVGGAIPTQGDPWTAFIMGNALLSVHAGPAFLSGGLGYSGKEQTTRKGGIDLVGQVGVDVLKTPVVGGIFAELRAPIITADRSFDEHHKLLLGFRIIF